MASVVSRWQALAPELKSVLRIVAALMFLQSGTVKLFGWPMAMPEGQSFSLMSEIGVGAILETVGGTLLLVGLFTRPVAFILSGEMAVAYFQFHFPNGFWPLVNQGQPAVLYCFIWLYLSAAGAGPWSLDAVLRRRP
jgi:putative oxidoreductase